MGELPFSLDTIELFFLMLVRVSCIVALLPVFGSVAVPNQVKVGLSLFLTILLFTTTMGAHSVELPLVNMPTLVLLVIKEMVVGLAMGFASSFLFSAVNFAARLVDTEMGFGMVDLVDPMGEESVTVLGQLWVIVFTLILLAINGHYFFMIAIQKSFEVIPAAGVTIHAGPLAQHFIDMVGMVFVLALKMSAPIYVALILTEMALGVVARTVPQINIFFVGLPMKIVVGLGTAMLVFPMLAELFKRIFEGVLQDIWTILYMMV
jgi:flagellar biosynthetic protein FliR